jgi:hypothetical protein
MNNKPFSSKIATLDPEKDHREIAFLLTCHCFPWDLERALEFALFRTFAVPSISKILAGTGEFTARPRKRYDDTELILYEILEHGMDSLRGKRAIHRMNDMHARFKISNGDLLYVLSTFIFEPIRWMDKNGWRPFTDLERQSIYINYRRLGERMQIRDIPNSLEEFEQFNKDYESRHFVFAQSNKLIGDKTVSLLLGFYLPKFLHGLGRPFVYALMDEPLRAAMGFPKPAGIFGAVVSSFLKLRARILRYFPERKEPLLGTKRRRPTYPEGYQIEELGTFAPLPSKREN